jgi:uncharacterized protein DUF1588/uncharacterized protein DUF1587/uncharacterized protein DUF1592/uncharacterized protein DUF1585/uncharacterized protein DUF1595/cbb3-type cytochrome c oxidase subunit III
MDELRNYPATARKTRPVSRLRAGARMLANAFCAMAICGAPALASPSAAEAPPAEQFRQTVKPLLEKYCFDCHADGANKGKVAFDEFKSDDALLNNRDLWWRALKNVRAGIMPPQKKPQPTPEEKKILAQWIKHGPFNADPASPDPGRVTLRRLNRVEYRNTIRDLMGIDYNTTEEFPPDDTGYGFDTVADALSLSPLLLEKYMQAAEAIVSTAVPKVGKVAPEIVIAARAFRAEGEAPARGDRMSFYKETKVTSSFTAKQAGDYEISVDLSVLGAFDFDPGEARVTFALDDHQLLEDKYKWQDHRVYKYDLKTPIEAGQHHLTLELHPLTPPEKKRTSVDLRINTIRVVGPMDPKLWHPTEKYKRFFSKDEPPESEGERREYARQTLRAFATKAFRRPVDENTLDRLVKLAEGRYNQPGSTFEQGIAHAMVAVLSSPRFLFRIEQPAPGQAKEPFALIDEYALASRLSYFFWSTMPDAELTDLASKGELRKNLSAQVKRLLSDSRSESLVRNFVGQWLEVRDVEAITIDARVVLAQDNGTEKELQQQLAEARARFAANKPPQANAAGQAGANGQAANGQAGAAQANPAQAGGAQAEGARGQAGAAANPQRRNGAAGQRPLNRNRFFARPAVELDGPLRAAIRDEVEMYFGYIAHEDRSVLELLDSDYTFANDKLAKLYGIKDVTGPDMRKITLPKDSPRGGILTMGSMLIVTSNPTRTSPVKRGQFILDNILGMPAPPPPADIPPLEAAEKNFADHEPSFRQVLEMHRDKPLCRSCHARMDPLGLALENFNALGMWREKERGQPIDPAGKLLTGEEFKNIRELKPILIKNHREDFYRCLTEKLMTYALGRGLDYYDVETVDQIVDRLERNDGKFSELLMGVVESAPFQKRRTIAPPAARPIEQRAERTQDTHEQRSSS